MDWNGGAICAMRISLLHLDAGSAGGCGGDVRGLNKLSPAQYSWPCVLWSQLHVRAHIWHVISPVDPSWINIDPWQLGQLPVINDVPRVASAGIKPALVLLMHSLRLLLHVHPLSAR